MPEGPTVFLLWHSYELDGEEESKLLGVYASEESAHARIGRARDLPGFRDPPDSFVISKYIVDRDEWREGFVTVPGDSQGS